MPRQAKDTFADLPQDFQDKIAQSSPEQIFKILADVNGEEQAQIKAKSEDQQLEEAKQAYASAGAGYKEALKGTKLRRAFINRVLLDKGKV